MKITQETPTALILKQRSFFPFILSLVFTIVGVYALISWGITDIKKLLISIVIIAFGLLVLIAAKFITIIIDKTANKITFASTGILGKKSQVIELNQIQEVAIEEYITQNVTNNHGPVNQLNFNLVFYLRDGQGIPVNIGTSSPSFSISGFHVGNFFGRNKIIEMGNKIASFIGVPFVDRRPPTVADMVSGIYNAAKNDNSKIFNPGKTINN